MTQKKERVLRSPRSLRSIQNEALFPFSEEAFFSSYAKCLWALFSRYNLVTKTFFAEVYSKATSLSASKFLKIALQNLPFPVKSIQVDGGSKFMDEFEKTAKL